MKARLPQGYSGGSGNMNNMLKQAQKMQEDAARVQEELEAKEYTSESGGGMVKVVYKGDHSLKSITINPEAVDPDDVEMLQDMIVDAVNKAAKIASDDASSEMEKVTGGLNLPGMNGLF